MKKINLAITGCMGRMGQQLIKSCKNDKNFKLTSLTESKIINKKIAGIKPLDLSLLFDPEEVFSLFIAFKLLIILLKRVYNPCS